MMENSKDESLEEIIKDLRQYEQNNADEKYASFVERLSNKSAEIQKERSSILNILAIVFIAFSMSLVGIWLLFDRNDALEQEKSTYEWKDSIFNAILKPDSNNSVSYLIRNGKIVTYSELEHENDSLHSVIVTNKAGNPSTVIEKKESTSEIDYYKDNKISILEAKLQLVQRNYPIVFHEKGDLITISSPQIDSALLILPYYRDRIKFNSKEKSWTVYFDKK